MASACGFRSASNHTPACRRRTKRRSTSATGVKTRSPWSIRRRRRWSRRSKSRGFIPTGWYSTAVCLTASGKRLVIANGKGSVSRPNAEQWKGADGDEGTNPGYIAKLLAGTLSLVDLPDEKTLARLSQQVHR